DAHPVAETLQFKVPVEPPARVLLAEQDDEQRPDEEQAAGRGDDGGVSVRVRVLPGATGDGADHDGDGDDREDAECGGHPVEVTIRVVNREPDWVFGLLWLLSSHVAPPLSVAAAAGRSES